VNALQAAILGAIQGLTEFVPISSSAHLLILRWLFGWEGKDVAFDAVIHLGTLAALLLFFWRDWHEMVRAYLSTTRFAKASRAVKDRSVAPQANAMLLWPVVFACVPAGLAGILFEDTVNESFRTKPLLTGSVLILMGLLLLAADRIGRKNRPMYSVRTRDWLIVGIAQALAFVPGVSRSGITITAGLFCGLEREASARFSFLLGAPIIFGAGIWELRKVLSHGLSGAEILPLLVGFLTATLVGFFCVKFLIGYLRNHSADLFVWYRVALGLALIATTVAGYIRA